MIVSVRDTQVFQSPLIALTEPHPFWWRYTPFPLRMSLLYFVPERRWRIRTIRTTRILHSSQGLQLYCSRLHNAWWCFYLALAEYHISPLHYCYISDAAHFSYMFSFEMLSHITIQSLFRIHHLPLHLLWHYRILQVWKILSNLHTL
jgi:hypothetical protein